MPETNPLYAMRQWAGDIIQTGYRQVGVADAHGPEAVYWAWGKEAAEYKSQSFYWLGIYERID